VINKLGSLRLAGSVVLGLDFPKSFPNIPADLVAKPPTTWRHEVASIRQKGNKFEVRVMVSGRAISRIFSTHDEGQRWAAGIKYGFIVPVVSRSQTATIPTLSDACKRYQAEVTDGHKGSKQERYRLLAMQQLSFANLPINKVTLEDMRAFKEQMNAKGLSDSTVRLNLALLSSLFRHARQEWGLVISNPAAEIKKPKPGKARTRRLSKEEEQNLMVALSACRNPQVIRIIQFFLETGMRKSEALNLTWDRIDLGKRLVTLEDTKNGHPRWIPLTQEAFDLLNEDPNKTGRAFPITESALTQAWGHALKRAGIKDLRIHDLRHEALSRWAHRLKGDVFKLSMISGHRTLQMAQRYVHPVQSELLAGVT
jgi:integrase